MLDAEESELPNPTEAEQPDSPASESSQPGSDRAPVPLEEKPQNQTEQTAAKNDATKKNPQIKSILKAELAKNRIQKSQKRQRIPRKRKTNLL